jgi:hypothetical protein
MPWGQLVNLVLLRGQDLARQHSHLRRPTLLEDRAGHLDRTQVMGLHAGREAQVELAAIQSGQSSWPWLIIPGACSPSCAIAAVASIGCCQRCSQPFMVWISA